MFLPLFRSDFYQYLAAISGAIAIVASGINLGWTSPYLPKLLDEDSSIPINPTEGSWCASMPLLGAPPGAILAAFLADRIGRKYTILLGVPTVFVCQVWMAFSTTILAICIERFIIGACEGLLYTVLPMYIGEIAVPNVRGLLTSTLTLASILGTLIINVIGPYTSIFTSSLIAAMVPLVHGATFLLMPESPYYYVKKQRFEKARSSLRVLRNCTDVDREFGEICVAVARQEQVQRATFGDLFRVQSNRRATFIYIIICLTGKFGGKNPCMFYTSMIFAEAESKLLSPQMSTIIYVTVELVASVGAILLVDRYGKRLLLIVSTAGCTLAITSLATYFWLKEHHSPWLDLINWWLPITSLVAYSVFYSCGLAFGGVAMLSELFPTNIKALALCSADSFSVTMAVIALKVFQITKDQFGMSTPFALFSCCSLLGLGLIAAFVPETKGKTLEEIQLFLMQKKTVSKDSAVSKTKSQI